MSQSAKYMSPQPSSAKDKRHVAQVEKALSTFESLTEWADYIAFIVRLKKALAVPVSQSQSLSCIPLSQQVSNRLSLCLSPSLPNGVHQKALELYKNIFNSLNAEALNAEISQWLPGLLPVISYGSMQVKPQLISLYQDDLVKYLDASTLRLIAKPFFLSLLSGLDDENSEIFSDCMSLLDNFKSRMGNNPHFWRTMFLCIITSPEKRLGALNWCLARLPTFTTINDGTEKKFSAEAQSCFSSEPGLLVRAFVSALNTTSSFNQASDINVIRGFFDLLLSHIPLKSAVLTDIVSPRDRELLLMSCCEVTLKKDMSLNRRLWNWLLGPEDPISESSAGHPQVNHQKEYFTKYALPFLESGARSRIDSSSTDLMLTAYKVSHALILDRWEISSLYTPKVFVPIVRSCFEAVRANQPGCQDLLVVAKAFFDEVEASFIWSYITCELILSGQENDLQMVEFLFENFKFPDEEKAVHAPLAVICYLLTSPITGASIKILSTMVELLQPHLAASIKESDFLELDSHSFMLSVKKYYENLKSDEKTTCELSSQQLTALLLQNYEKWYIESLKSGLGSDLLANIMDHSLLTVSTPKGFTNLKQAFLAYPQFSFASTDSDENVSIILFGMSKICRHLTSSLTSAEKSKVLKILLSNLWSILASAYPANNQVEAVRCIFELPSIFEVHEVEAGVIFMLLKTPLDLKYSVFLKLWSHSSDFSGAESILSNALLVILESLEFEHSGEAIETSRLVNKIVLDGSANRLLKVLTNPLLSFDLMQKEKVEITTHDDSKLFKYYLKAVLNCVLSNEKLLKDSLNHEYVSSENTEKIQLFNSNQWDISNYKSLILCVIRKFLGLKLSAEVAGNEKSKSDYTQCASCALDLYKFVITGSELDFEDHFKFLLDSCSYLASYPGVHSHSLELLETMYLKTILDFLAMAKKLNVAVMNIKDTENHNYPLLISFITNGIAMSQSSTLLEKWFSLLNKCLYMLGENIFDVLLVLSDSIVHKIEVYFNATKAFKKISGCTDIESSLTICISGLEDLLSISHSHLITSSMRPVLKSQQNENGFLGNVISGVFQIESPLVKTQEEQKKNAVIISFQDATKIAFEIWSWADGRDFTARASEHASVQSMINVSNKLKFRSRRLLESLSELERHEVIEKLIDANSNTDTKIKILHVLDSGHTHLTIPHILNSILTRCSPQSLSEKDMSTMYTELSEEQLASFLVKYYQSIDQDSIDDIYDVTASFVKEVLAHPSLFKKSIISYLKVIKVFSLKLQGRKSKDNRSAHHKELSGYFLSMLNASVSKKVQDSRNSEAEENKKHPGDDLADDLSQLVQFFGDVLQDSDKVSTAVTTIISTVIPSPNKAKKSLSPSILNLVKVIGKFHPIKPWKQLVGDLFMDNSFFANGRSTNEDWKVIVQTWVQADPSRIEDLVTRVTPSVQSNASNIFVWNESSEVEDRTYVLRRISYLMMVQPIDACVNILNGLFGRLGTALNSTCPPPYKSEALKLFRVLSVRISESQLLPYWSFMTQTLSGVFQHLVPTNVKQLASLDQDQVKLILSASKMLDQLLLIGFDEFNLNSWLFVASDYVTGEKYTQSYIDHLGSQTESMVTKDTPIRVRGPEKDELAAPLLYGITSINNVANLKIFFGSLSYINFERSFGLAKPDISACEKDIYKDLEV